MNKIINNIRNFKFLYDSELIIIDTKFNIERVIGKTKIGYIKYAYDIFFYENDIIITENYYGKAFVIDPNNVITNFLGHKYSVYSIEDIYAIVYWDNEFERKSYFGILDISSDILIFKKGDYMNKKLFLKILLCFNNNEIQGIDFINDKVLWQFSVKDFPPYINGFYREQEADIKQIIGVYNTIYGFMWAVCG